MVKNTSKSSNDRNMHTAIALRVRTLAIYKYVYWLYRALCHADYGMPSNIKIESYSDRVEITNPGGIYRYNVDDILLGIQSFRNPKLIALLHKLGFIGNYGTVIKRIREAYPNYDIGSFLINSHQWFGVTLPDLNHKNHLFGNNVPQNVPQTDLDKIIVAIRKKQPNHKKRIGRNNWQKC